VGSIIFEKLNKDPEKVRNSDLSSIEIDALLWVRAISIHIFI